MAFEPLFLFNQSTTLISQSGYYEVIDGCNAYIVTNVGDTTVFVNDQVLFPGTVGSVLGDSRTFGGHSGEVYKGILKVQFQAPVGAVPRLEIVQKFYI